MDNSILRFSDRTIGETTRIVIDPNGRYCHYTDLAFYRNQYRFVLGFLALFILVILSQGMYIAFHTHETSVPVTVDQNVLKQDSFTIHEEALLYGKMLEVRPTAQKRLAASREKARRAETVQAAQNAQASIEPPVSVDDRTLIAMAVEAGFSPGTIRVKP